MMRRSPAITAVAVLILALGLGANTAVFSFVDALLLRPLSLQGGESLVRVYGADSGGAGFDTFSHPNYLDLRERNRVLEDLAAHQQVTLDLGFDGGTEAVAAEIVSGNYFDVLRVRPLLGRMLRPDDDVSIGGHPVAVIAHGLWKRRFGADPQVIGRAIRLNGHPFSIVGVAPEEFHGTFEAFRDQLWVPMAMHEEVRPRGVPLDRRGWGWLHGTGRLRPGVTLEAANADLDRVAAGLETDYPGVNRGFGVQLYRASALPEEFQEGVSGFLGFFLLLVALVLVITCANLASILLARVTSRRQEIAVRRSLGATRLSLLRQWMVESMLLSLLGGAAGVLLALWMRDAILALAPTQWTSFAPDLRLDARVLGFSILAAAGTGALFGLFPALHASATRAWAVMKQEAPGGPAARSRFFGVSVASQVMISLMLLIVAGLFLRSIRAADAFDPGFQADRLAIASVALGRHGYDEPRGRAFYRQALERLSRLPGVESASFGLVVPLGLARERLGFQLEGVEPPAGRDTVSIDYNVVGPDYFRTLGIPILRGREFGPRDSEQGAAPAVLVNETLARKFWPGQDPIGKTLRLGGAGPALSVIGVARDIKYYSLGEAPRPYVYGSFSQLYFDQMVFHVRTAVDPASVLPEVRDAIQAVAPGLAVDWLMTLAELRRIPLFPNITLARVSALFGALALALTGLGIYGVVSYSVNRRTQEIGVRMALGAGRVDILRTVVGRIMTWALTGAVIGLAGILAVSRLLTDLLFGITPLDPATYGGVSVLLGLVALLAAYLPARRAARLDPVRALRYE